MKNILRALLLTAAALTVASLFNTPSASVLDNTTMIAFGTPLPICPPVCPNPCPPNCERSHGSVTPGKIKPKKSALPQPR